MWRKREFHLRARTSRQVRIRDSRRKCQSKYLQLVDFAWVGGFSIHHSFFCSQLSLWIWRKKKERGMGSLPDVWAAISSVSHSYGFLGPGLLNLHHACRISTRFCPTFVCASITPTGLAREPCLESKPSTSRVAVTHSSLVHKHQKTCQIVAQSLVHSNRCSCVCPSKQLPSQNRKLGSASILIAATRLPCTRRKVSFPRKTSEKITLAGYGN